MTTTTPAAPAAESVPRRGGVTEQAAVAAIDAGTRLLRLPTMGDRYGEIAAAAQREQLTTSGSWPSW